MRYAPCENLVKQPNQLNKPFVVTYEDLATSLPIDYHI